MNFQVNSTIPVAAVLVLAFAAQGFAASYTVDGSGGGDFTTIQAAINAANPGDTINVNAGTYDEAISMNKPLNLIGSGSNNTVITYTAASGSAIEQNFFLGDNDGEDFTGFATLIEGFTFQNGGNLTGDNDLIKFRARGVGGTITIRDNVFDGQGSTSVKGIEESQGGRNFVISSNIFTGLRYGMYLNDARDGDIDGNSFDASSSGAIGINPDASSTFVPNGERNFNITGNTIENGHFGILIGDGNKNITIESNIIRNNSGSLGAGILYWDDDSSHNAGTEFESDNIVIVCNDIYGNDEGIRGYIDPADPPAPQKTWDATDNWWGHGSGPSGRGAGSGDSVLLENVDFSNWATAPKVIPEPASIALLGLGGLALLRRRQQR